MKKSKVQWLLAVLAVIMMVGTAGMTVSAKTKTDKLTLLVGDKVEYFYIGIGNVKSVKSSKKSVVTAKKVKGGSKITAKKAGKANVTVKGARGKWVHKVTVKKPSFDIKTALSADKRYINVTFKNKTSVFLNYVELTFTFKNSKGENLYTYTGEPYTSTGWMYSIGKNNTANCQIYIPQSYKDIDLSKTTCTYTWKRYSADSSYTNYSNKVTVKSSKKGDYINIKATSKYKGKKEIYIGYDILFYDANKQLIQIDNRSTSLSKYRKNSTIKAYVPNNMASYTIKKRIWLEK